MKFEKLDALIVAKCQTSQTFGVLASDDLIKAEASAHVVGGADSWRVVDRRLQALRKAGRITFSRAAGWLASRPTPTATK